jgi:hypothetical protein
MRYSLFLIAVLTFADTAPLTDEALRTSTLQAIFPRMQIEKTDLRIDDSAREASADAFAHEAVYRVTGATTNQAEREASAQTSTTRLVRFQLYRWPDKVGVLAVLQYKFEDATPSMACPSIGLLVHLINGQVHDRYLLETSHHTALKTVRVLNLDGGFSDQLVIESDFGGNGAWGVNLLAFRLEEKLDPVFKITSQITSGTGDLFEQKLEVPATIQMRGTQYCFTKTTAAENGIAYAPVRVSKVCYATNENFVKSETEERDKLLKQ